MPCHHIPISHLQFGSRHVKKTQVGGLILVSAFSSIKAAVQSIVGLVLAWTFTERFPNSRRPDGPDGPGELMEDELGWWDGDGDGDGI